MGDYNGPYPLRYFSGRRGIKSDRDWILAGMSKIPESRRHEVADNYDRIFCQSQCDLAGRYLKKYSSNREAANRYLKDQVAGREIEEAPAVKIKPTTRIGGTFFDNFV